MKQIDLATFLDLTGYDNEERKARRKEEKSEEFFTPYSLVMKMCSKIPEEKWNDPDAEMLEPSMGNGNFVLAMIYLKIIHGSSWKQSLEHVFGVELFQQNVNECHNRVIDLLKAMDLPDFDESIAREIMKENLVCSNFFNWDFLNWCPLEEKNK